MGAVISHDEEDNAAWNIAMAFICIGYTFPWSCTVDFVLKYRAMALFRLFTFMGAFVGIFWAHDKAALDSMIYFVIIAAVNLGHMAMTLGLQPQSFFDLFCCSIQTTHMEDSIHTLYHGKFGGPNTMDRTEFERLTEDRALRNHYDKGRNFLEYAKESKTLAVLLSGKMGIYEKVAALAKPNERGSSLDGSKTREILTGCIYPMDFINHLEWIAHEQGSATRGRVTIRCEEDCTVLEWDRTNLAEIFKQYPRIMSRVTSFLGNEIAEKAQMISGGRPTAQHAEFVHHVYCGYKWSAAIGAHESMKISDRHPEAYWNHSDFVPRLMDMTDNYSYRTLALTPEQWLMRYALGEGPWVDLTDDKIIDGLASLVVDMLKELKSNPEYRNSTEYQYWIAHQRLGRLGRLQFPGPIPGPIAAQSKAGTHVQKVHDIVQQQENIQSRAVDQDYREALTTDLGGKPWVYSFAVVSTKELKLLIPRGSEITSGEPVRMDGPPTQCQVEETIKRLKRYKDQKAARKAYEDRDELNEDQVGNPGGQQGYDPRDWPGVMHTGDEPNEPDDDDKPQHTHYRALEELLANSANGRFSNSTAAASSASGAYTGSGVGVQPVPLTAPVPLTDQLPAQEVVMNSSAAENSSAAAFSSQASAANYVPVVLLDWVRFLHCHRLILQKKIKESIKQEEFVDMEYGGLDNPLLHERLRLHVIESDFVRKLCKTVWEEWQKDASFANAVVLQPDKVARHTVAAMINARKNAARMTNARLLSVDPAVLDTNRPLEKTSAVAIKYFEPLFEHLQTSMPSMSPRELLELINWGKWRVLYKPGSVFVRQNECPQSVGVLMDGLLTTYTEDEILGSRTFVNMIQKNELVGSEDFQLTMFHNARHTIEVPTLKAMQELVADGQIKDTELAAQFRNYDENPQERRQQLSWGELGIDQNFQKNISALGLEIDEDLVEKVTSSHAEWSKNQPYSASNMMRQEKPTLCRPTVMFLWDADDIKRLMAVDARTNQAMSTMLGFDLSDKHQNSVNLGSRFCGVTTHATTGDGNDRPMCGNGDRVRRLRVEEVGGTE